jgi:membrane fusion protein (multidrug efflux system)
MKRIISFVVVFLFLALFTGGLGYFQFIVKPQMIRGFIAKAAPPPTAVAIDEAKAETWAPRLAAIGTFRAIQGVDVAPQVGGIVRSISVDSGQDVAKGAPLFEIDDTVEQADLKNNLATLKNAQLTLDRQRQLVASGNTTKANVDSAEAARDTAAAAVERVRALLAQKALAAPFAGRLGIRKIDLGQYVSPGTSFITLQQLDPMFIDFTLPEQALAVLRPGQVVEVQVDAYPGETFQGTIKTVDARVSAETRNVNVRAEIANGAHRFLPGMFANVNAIAGAPREVVTVPRTAITYSLYGDSVFVVQQAPPAEGGAQAATPAYRVERRFVRPGDVRQDRVAILDGVKAGERVVTQGQLKLQNDMAVRLDTTSGLVAPAVRPRE